MYYLPLFAIILLIKSYIVWDVVFDAGTLWEPMLTEVPFILILFCLVEWFTSKRKLAFYIGLNIVITSVFFAAIMYYKYYGVIVTYHALHQINQVTAVKDSVFSLIDPYYILIFIDIPLLFIAMRYSKGFNTWITKGKTRLNPRLISVLMVVSLCICSFNILPNRASMNEFVQAQKMGILSYEAYKVVDEIEEEKSAIPVEEITQEMIHQLKALELPDHPQFWQAAKDKHLLSIQLESFQQFLIGLRVDGQEVTPNLNRLAAEHFYFPHFFQQVGSGNTSDTEFVVNTSFYIPPVGAATDYYAKKELPSLPKLLSEHGYISATFHTNEVKFWNRHQLYPALGFDQYYDAEFFGDEDRIFFGASDEILYAKTAEQLLELEQAGKPIYAHIVSMSAHHPYTLPDEKQSFELPERFHDTMIGQYLIAQHYADYSLGLFIEELQESGLWERSLLVLYGDHLGLPIYLLEKEDQQLLAEMLGHEYRRTDMLNVPFIVADADFTYPTVWEQIGGHVDHLPTIANLLGISLEQQLHFGQDLFNHEHNLLPQRYYLPSGSFINDHAVFVPGEGFYDGSIYPIQPDQDIMNLADYTLDETPAMMVSEDEYNRALKLLHLSNSVINQLPELE